MDKQAFSPIFIVGSPRSGTSILALALQVGAGIPGYNEGHLAPLLYTLFRCIDAHYMRRQDLLDNPEHLLSNVKSADLKREIARLFEKIYLSLHEKTRFFEKTGDEDMIRACPLLAEVWPESKFIFAKRRGIENVISRTKKFPDIAFETHCQDWTNCMTAWLEVRSSLANCVEVDQYDTAVNPADVAATLSEFLALDDATTERLKTVLVNERPQQTREIPDEQRIALSSAPWTPGQRRFFAEKCGQAMHAYGYSFEG